MTPSASRRATLVLPGFSFSAKSFVTSSVIGIVQSVPLAQSHLAADGFVVGLVHEAGERREAAVESISRSQTWRGVRSQEGQSRDCALISRPAAAGRRSMSSPPCGWTRWLIDVVNSLDLRIDFVSAGTLWLESGKRELPICRLLQTS